MKTVFSRSCKRACLAISVLVLVACASTPAGNKVGADKVINESFAVKNSLAQALAAIDKGDYETAASAFQQMIKKGARSPDSLNHYAIYLREQWKIDEAEKVYLQALVLAPNSAMTNYNLGILYELYMGKQDLALKHYRRYQKALEEPDKKVAAWIKALEREQGGATTGEDKVAEVTS
ncbi:MAG: tetratricopeptide repeat protein [Gammaproteobacteria bacterium]|nr:tetratricopeptide repeat protein [Gammaproteobacteria bacterium]NNL11818.1 tetratricopeptide repeat protein [Pseudomonadales bacterium]NNM12503.1 tetratricopeptide repeat protein [Pseudomonadales bacterium]